MFNAGFVKILNIMTKILIKIHFPNQICKFVNDFRHYYVMKKLKKYFQYAYNKLTDNDNYTKNNIKSTRIIWTFWWQGNSNMPIIIKKCLNSIYKHSSNHKVIVINKYNFKKYVDLPSWLLNKFDKGYISIPHFSDIIRFKLLEKYGGLWLDSTIYCNRELDKNYFNNIYTSGGNMNKYHNYVSGKWSSFLIGGSKHNDAFIFMNYFYKIYWKQNDKLIDYFLMDYALNYVYDNDIGNFGTYVDKIAYLNNPHIHDLENMLNETYDENMFHTISNDTEVFKLTYKIKLLSNENTFYNKIVNK